MMIRITPTNYCNVATGNFTINWQFDKLQNLGSLLAAEPYKTRQM
jgi:hypothetical protein